jgi:centromeric protein E
MLGNQKDERGVLEMAAEDIFTHICNTAGRDFLLRVSFVEIYNEIIRDLLSDASDATVNIREDPKRGVYCEASESVITDYESIIRALKKGISRRAVEATAMNDTSSRSHTIFKLVIESKENGRGDNADPDGAVLVSSLNLVDLAGSESVRHTGATGQRAKEGGKINQSLLSLSRVIHALSQPGAHVSFRDSKLTRLLQPSLSGNAKMSVVCCITPAEKYLEETRSTLQFASRAKLVKTHAVVNEVLDEVAALKRLKKELEELKEKQRANTGLLSEEEQARIEAEKADMLARLESLQKERDVQLQQLERLKELIVVGEKSTAAAAAAVDRTKRRKRHRDTWCPGATSAVFSLAPVMVASDVVVDDENMLDQEDGASAGDRSAGSCKSDMSSGSVIVQALSAQLASRDDVIAALRDQIREMQQVPGSNKNTNLEKMDGSYEDEEEEDGDDTVPLEEDDKEAVGQQLAEALVQVQSLTAVVSDKEAQVAELTQVLERHLHEAEAAAQADAQTESLVRGLEEDVARAQEQLEQAQTVVAQLTQRVQGLEGELAQAHARVPPHSEAVDEHAQEQIGTLTAELASAEELIQEMEADAAAVRQSLEESHQREENLAVAVQEADAEVGALREQIAALELQLEGALSDLSEQRAQFVESSKEHQAAQAQAAEALELARSEAAVLLAAKEQELAGAAELKGYAEAAGPAWWSLRRFWRRRRLRPQARTTTWLLSRLRQGQLWRPCRPALAPPSAISKQKMRRLLPPWLRQQQSLPQPPVRRAAAQ